MLHDAEVERDRAVRVAGAPSGGESLEVRRPRRAIHGVSAAIAEEFRAVIRKPKQNGSARIRGSLLGTGIIRGSVRQQLKRER
jgi:hypothetical protein